jgi:hypothetical protein
VSKINIYDNKLPILEWDSFVDEIVNFHKLHKDTFEEFAPTDEDSLSVREVAHELFVHLIHDYAMSKLDTGTDYSLNYRLAEA